MRSASALLGLMLAMVTGASIAGAEEPCPTLLRHSFPRLQDDVPQSLCQFGGKVVLIVNTASFCGYTRQYEALEGLHRKYGERGFAVVGFPSNDFGQQEPGSNAQIAEFCRSTYGIRFPMFGKTSVKVPGTNPLFDELANRTGARPKWNFHKYLIDRGGRSVLSFPSAVEPDSPVVVGEIEKMLAARP